VVQSQPRQIVCETLSQKNPSQKKGLVEWLKVEALSTNSKLQYHKKKKKKFEDSLGNLARASVKIL
jgi:hypothetical protein